MRVDTTFSFVMPAYKSCFLKSAIQSIINQTFDDFELIVVDDCSPDDLESIVRQFDDERVRYYRNKENIGGKDLVKQWNYSVSLAKGEWIILAADDDLYDCRFCEEVKKLIDKNPAVDLVRSRVEQIDGEDRHIWSENSFPEHISCYEFLHDWLVGKSFTCVGNYAFRASRLREKGGFVNFPCGFCSDLATPFLLAENGVANTDGLLFSFRQTDNHLSADTSRLMDKTLAITSFYEWLDKFEYQSPVMPEDIEFYSFKNHSYIHGKCIFDYFNQVIKLLPLQELTRYLKACSLASASEKFIFILRWLKRKIL